MSLLAGKSNAEIEIDKSDKNEKLKDIANVLKILNKLNEGATVNYSPSSVMLQILKYGKAFKRVTEHVEFDFASFNKKLESLLSSGGKLVNLYKTFYKHKWTTSSVEVPTGDVEKILEPLKSLDLGGFRFRNYLKYNEKFEEALESFVKDGKVNGKVFYDEDRNRLIIFSRVYSKHSMGTYYVLFMMEPERSGEIRTLYFCTCPWARGETVDSRGRYIPPEYTSFCKHGLATLFFYFPEIATYIKLVEKGKLSKAEFERHIPQVRQAFGEVIRRMADYVSKHPEAKGIVYSNVLYIVVRELYEKFQKLGYVKKFVPTIDALSTVSGMWDSIRIVRKVVSRSGSEAIVEQVIDVEKVVTAMRTLYDRVKELEDLLNGLQGSKTTTLYTKALLAGLVLGSDLESDPTIVSVVGDPGTGKTLTAAGLSRLVGIRSIVVEKDVEESSLREEMRSIVAVKMSRVLKFFSEVIEPRIPENNRAEARRFIENFIEKAPYLTESAGFRELVRFAKNFAETFTSLYGVKGKKIKLTVARLFYEILKHYRKVYEKYVNKEAIERKALEERRKLLKVVSDLGLISKPEDKEELNSGAVRWEIGETVGGYRVRIVIDLHYLIRRYGGDVDKIVEAIKTLSKHGRIYVRTEVPGMAELKLSEAEYLEKALRVREEDILSPAKRLIWVGGELTKRTLILIDESRRSPELLERLLTDLSSAARDTRRTNLVVTTDNAEPLMEAESDPRLDAFHSRVNFEVVTPSTTVAYIISKTLKKISELEREGKVPLITLDEALLLNFASENVKFPERYEKVLYAIPLLLIYDFKILRPEIVDSLYDASTTEKVTAPPIVLLVPKGMIDEGYVEGDYVNVNWGRGLPAIRMMPERRFGHHVVRASKALAILKKKTTVDKETFLSALEMVLMARVIPSGSNFPYLYINDKTRVVEAIIDKVREFIDKKETATEHLIEELGSLATPSKTTVIKALEEMINSPVATAVFVRFVEQMLVSEHGLTFITYSSKVPGLYRCLNLIRRYEKIRI